MRNNLSKLVLVLTLFLGGWLTTIAFTEKLIPFSRLGMFSSRSKTYCNELVYKDNKVWPLRGFRFLQVQDFIRKHSKKPEVCQLLASNYTYLPSRFEIRRICHNYIDRTDKIEKGEKILFRCLDRQKR